MTILMMGVYSMGGTTRTAMNLARYLSQRYDVEVVSVNRGKREPYFTFPPRVTVTPLDDNFSPRGKGWRVARGLLARCPSLLINVEDSRYRAFSLWTDLLILSHLRSTTGVLIATRPGLNVVAAAHAPPGVRVIGQEHMNLASHGRLLRAGVSRYYPRLDALAVLTSSDLRNYTQFFGSGRPPVVQMPNAVPALDGGLADTSSNVVIAAGRLTKQKGFDRLIPAWAPIASAHPDWALQIYGGGVEHGRLKGLIAEHRVGSSVTLMGRTDRIGHAYAKASIFVLSSRREGLPMVILEAMSKGLPVVSFDCPTGPSEVVATGENGVLVPNADVAALTRSLLDVIEDDGLRARLGKGAVETAAGYDIEVIGRKWAHLIDRLLGQPDRSRR